MWIHISSCDNRCEPSWWCCVSFQLYTLQLDSAFTSVSNRIPFAASTPNEGSVVSLSLSLFVEDDRVFLKQHLRSSMVLPMWSANTWSSSSSSGYVCSSGKKQFSSPELLSLSQGTSLLSLSWTEQNRTVSLQFVSLACNCNLQTGCMNWLKMDPSTHPGAKKKIHYQRWLVQRLDLWFIKKASMIHTHTSRMCGLQSKTSFPPFLVWTCL